MKVVYPDSHYTPNHAPAGCANKERHETRDAANRAMLSVQRTKRLRGQAHSYRCPYCHGYHWGHLRHQRT